jgi:hypothetical protein
MPISTIGQNGLNAPLSLTTPNLGTPSAINLSNATALPKAALPTGSILQVVSTSISSTQSTSSTSFVASNLITTITPTSATSKILILLNGGTRDANQSTSQQTAMYRNIASAGYSSLSVMEGLQYDSGNPRGGHSFNYLDSPATTSSISYQPYFRATAGTVWFNNGGVVSLTLMEIAA